MQDLQSVTHALAVTQFGELEEGPAEFGLSLEEDQQLFLLLDREPELGDRTGEQERGLFRVGTARAGEQRRGVRAVGDSSPEIDLPGEAESDREPIRSGRGKVGGIGAGAGGRGVEIDLGVQECTGDPRLGVRLFEA